MYKNMNRGKKSMAIYLYYTEPIYQLSSHMFNIFFTKN